MEKREFMKVTQNLNPLRILPPAHLKNIFTHDTIFRF
jgi:hypothetical protein